jgi:trehalose/maltose hydrolase-like predicted phosphorylase
MRRGALCTECSLLNASALAVRSRSLHLVSLSQRSIGLQLIQLQIEDGDIDVTLDASFEGMDFGLVSERRDQDLEVWRTISSGQRLAMAVALSLEIDDHVLAPTFPGLFQWSWRWTSRPGQIASFKRSVCITRSDAKALILDGGARKGLASATQIGWRRVVSEHETAWAARWRCSEVEVDGDDAARRSLRFAVYHLNSAANPSDERVSIAARALTGDDYHGHVFWDTEIFLLPFYILSWPEAARALLMYRYGTLDAARAKADRMGWRGALYAWESADSGAEATPTQVIGPDRQVVEVYSGKLEQHISADVAYAVWQYWLGTGDEEFLLAAGAEMMLETARFWASRAMPEGDRRCHIRSVIGPDEYHENIDDNAYTNVMARWNIQRALDVSAMLRERWPERWAALSRQLGLGDGELERWRNVAVNMATGLDERTGVYEQFHGYHALEEIDLKAYSGRSVPMDVVIGRDRTQRSKIIKQADVVALLALLPEEFPGDMGMANFNYYAPRCGHGSSLSRAMHGIAAARLGASELALDFFRQTAAIDLADNCVAIDGGLHIAALGGIWQMAVFGFAGLSLNSNSIAFNPRLPAGWRRLCFRVQWHRRCVRIAIEQGTQSLEATLESGEAMKLVVGGNAYDLHSGATIRCTSSD